MSTYPKNWNVVHNVLYFIVVMVDVCGPDNYRVSMICRWEKDDTVVKMRKHDRKERKLTAVIFLRGRKNRYEKLSGGDKV